MDDDRAVSITLTYILTVAITTVLVAGVVVASTDMLESQRDDAVENQLTIVGERLASELTTLDRVAQPGQPMTIETSHPDRVTDTGYSVSLVTDHVRCDVYAHAGSCLLLEAGGTDTVVVVPVGEGVDVESDATVPGGRIDVVFDGDRLALREGER